MRNRKLQIVVFVLVVVNLLSVVTVSALNNNQNISVFDTDLIAREDLKNALHPKIRITPYPSSNQPRLNPATFLWPAKERDARYVVELSRTKDFRKVEFKSDTIGWACFNPHKKMDKGSWYWRVSVIGKKGTTVSEPYHFTMGNQPLFETPRAKTFLNNIPGAYPRILATPNSLNGIRERVKGTLLEKEIMENAEKFLLTEVLPIDEVIKKVDGNYKPHELAQILDVQVLNWLQARQLECTYMSIRYMLTGEKKYAEAAIKRALYVAKIDKKYSNNSDFCQGKILDTYIYVFDNCYDQLTREQREVLLKEIKFFAGNFYHHFRNYLETHVYENHIWQKTLGTMFKAALTTYGKIPEAELWLKYTYEAWTCRAPMGGFELQGGGITEGTGYLTADMVTLIQLPTLLSRYAGMNFYSHPWFKNAPYSLLMNWPSNSYSNGFGDGHGSPTNPRWQQATLIKILASANNDPVASWFYQRMQQDPRCQKPRSLESGAKHPLDSEFIEWFGLVDHIGTTAPLAPANLGAAVFPETGTAVAHSNYTNVKDNVFVAFNASAYGSGSHSQCDQNSFNIIAGGLPLFLSSGHYINFSDKHNLLHYRSSRGHNTVLVDGLSQTLGAHGYGNIRRFYQTDDYVYIMGDASKAYNGVVTDPMWIENMKNSGVEHSRENGYGRAGLKRFYRHVLFIKPSTLIVYDDLEAKEPVSWTWLLHSRKEMTGDNNQAETTNGLFKGRMQLFSTNGFKAEINDKFESPAVNWMAKPVDGKLPEKENHWHYRAYAPKSGSVKFFAVFQIVKEGEAYKAYQVKSGEVSGIGIWSVSAAMDGASGLVLKKEGKIVLNANQSTTQAINSGKMLPLRELPVVSSR